MVTGWLTRSRADVPAGDGWLGERERAVLAGFTIAKRREDWRLGRWTAKAALAAWLGGAPGVEILAAPDGAPEAWLGDERVSLSLSLSHRAGVALAAVAAAPCGCDIELIEPRSEAFVADWLAPEEQARVAAAADRALAANLAWTAKEAAAKVLREGLRLDVRHAVARIGEAPGHDGWRPLTVEWAAEGTRTAGWWRTQDGYVMTLAGPGAPRRL